MRAALDRTWRVAANGLGVVLIVLAAHSWPAREQVRLAAAAAATRHTGSPVSIGLLRYNLLTLQFDAADVLLEPAHRARIPRIRAGRVDLRLSWRALLAGRLAIDRVVASDVDVLSPAASTGIGVDLERLSLTASRGNSGGLSGRVHLDVPGWIRIGSSTRPLERLDGGIAFNGGSVAMTGVHLAAPGLVADVAGTVTDALSRTARMSINGSWHGRAAELCDTWLSPDTCELVQDGSLRGRFTLSGGIASPVLHIDLEEGRLAGQTKQIAVAGEAIVSPGSIEVPQLRVAAFGGTALVRGSVATAGPLHVSRATLTWNGMDARDVLDAVGVAAPVAGTVAGEAVLTGEPMSPSTMVVDARASLVGGAARTGLSVGGGMTARLAGGRWSVHVAGARIGATSIQGVASGRAASSYDARAWLRVPLDGSLLLETTDAGETMRTLGALGIAQLPVIPDAWHAGAAARVRLGGTIGRPAATARLQVAAVHSTESDPLAVDAELSVDAAAVRVESLQAVRGDDRLEGCLSYQRATGGIEAAFTATVADLGSLDDLSGAAGWSLRGEAAAAGQIFGTMLRPRARAMVRASGVEVISPGIPDVAGVTTISLGDVSANVAFEDRIEFRIDLPARRIAAAGVLDRKPGWPFDVSVALQEVDVGEVISVRGSGIGDQGSDDRGSSVRSETAPAMTGMLDGTVALAGHLRPADWHADLRLTRAHAVLQGIEARLVRPGRVRIESSRVVEASLDLSVGDLQFRVARGDPMDAVHVLVEGRLPPNLFAPFDAAMTTIDAAITPRGIEIRKALAQWEGATAEATAQLPMWLIERWLPVPLHGWGDEDEPGAVVRLEARAIPVAAVSRRLFPDADGVLQGVFDVVLEADADAPSLDAIRLDGRIERSRLDIAGMVLEQQGAAAVAVRKGEASLTGWSLSSPGAALALRARSTIGHDFETVVTGELDLGTALHLAGNRTAGTARVDMAVRADPEGMSWNGQMELRDAGWVSRRRRLAFTDVNGIMACTAQGCRVEAFDAQLNGGTVQMTGVLAMREAAATGLQVTLRGIALELPPGTRHDVDADLELGGIGAPRLTGMATVWPGPVNDSLTSLASLIASSYGSRVLAPTRDAVTAALSRVPLDVRVATGDDLTFASQDLQVTATADLRLRGTLARPLLLGEVAALDRGSVFLAGRTWDLERATVSLLDRPDGADVRIAVALTTRISQYLVQIAMSGPARQPALVMTSDPPLGQSDLAELVLTGTTTGSFSAGGHQVAGLVSGELLSSVGRIVGMDAVRIEQHQSDLSAVELEPVARLTVSKRITDKFEVVYSQGLSEEDDLAWVLIFRPDWKAVDLRATIRTNGAEAYEIRQELEFGHPARTSRQSRPRRPSAMVSRVDVVGVSAEEAAAVSRGLSIRAGDEFTTDGWQRDRQEVSEYFRSRDRFRVRVRARRAEVSDGTYVLSYDIAPGPMTRLEVRGYTPDETTLASLREAWGRVAADDLVVEELTDVLRIELADRGYLDAAVSTTFTSLADGGRAVVVDVSPGARSRGRSIEVAGNAAVSVEDVTRAIAERQIGPRSWLVPSLVEEPVTELYSARGFLAARVTAVRTVGNRAATLNVHIDEGHAFKVGTVAFSGTASLGEAAARESFGVAPGAPFDEASVSRAVAGLRAAYLRAGYLDADVASATAVSRERGVVDLAVTVREGQPSVLRDIQVEGRDETSASLVAAAWGVRAGGAADPIALDEAQQRLYDTGIFRTVDVDIQPLDEPDASATDRPVRAVVTVEERPRYRLRYGIQFGPTTIENVSVTSNSAEPGATFDLQRRNLFGKGIVAGGGAIWSADQHRIRGTMSAATFRGRFVSTTLTAEHVNQDRESDTGTQVVDRSARAVLEQRWRFGRARRVEIAYGFDVDQRHVELWTTPTTIPVPLEGRFADLNATFVYDTRDNRFNPRRGTFHTSRVEAGAGLWISDVAFGRYQVQQFAYTPIGAVTLASGVRFASLDVDNEREPAALLLYFKTGGGTSVRGYDTDSLTPAYLGGVPVGGKVLLVLNEEVRVHATRRVGVAAFVDAGNTFEGFETFGLHELKVGVGAGLRLETPVAVLRLDVGLPIPRPPGGPRARWYLSLGQPF